MFVDAILIGIALAAGIIGTVWGSLHKIAKAALVFLAIATSVAAIVKAYTGDKDKELLQNLAIAGLALPNFGYDRVYAEIDRTYPTSEGYYHHTSDGLTRISAASGGKPSQILVFNRYEVARIYADAIRGRNPKSFLKEVVEKHYPDKSSDEYKDKVALLGIGVFFDMCKKDASGYAFDDSIGVKLFYDDQGKQREIVIEPGNVRGEKATSALDLFATFDKLFREKIQRALPDCH